MGGRGGDISNAGDSWRHLLGLCLLLLGETARQLLTPFHHIPFLLPKIISFFLLPKSYVVSLFVVALIISLRSTLPPCSEPSSSSLSSPGTGGLSPPGRHHWKQLFQSGLSCHCHCPRHCHCHFYQLTMVFSAGSPSSGWSPSPCGEC